MAKNVDWKSRLSKLRNYKEAKEESKSVGGGLADGRYKVKVTKAQLGESQSSGREQISVYFEVLEGDCEGQTGGVYLGLDEKSLRFTLSALGRLGHEIPEDPADIVDIVNNINNDQGEIVIGVKNGFTNIVGKVEKEDNFGQEENAETEESEETPEEPETESEETEEETEAVSVGSKVSFVWGEDELTGEVVSIDEAAGKLVIRTDDKKKYKVSAEKASLITEIGDTEVEEEEETEEEEEEEQPKERVKKVANKKVAKKQTAKKK